ncbi:methyltransferase domain-containing protein [Candidatus Kaiserbacteria bacterium]|nr:methyltransferase domain-containing protein [Candidatus Kaiserbacteria bacterium]
MRTEVTFFNQTSSDYLAEYDRGTPEGYSFRVRREKVFDVLEPGEGKRVLDLASGPGIMIKGLREHDYEVTCVDAAPDMIELAKRVAGNDPHVTCEVGDAYGLRFDTGSFDTMIAMGLIEYLEDQARFLGEAARVVKSGGYMIITVPNVWSPWRMWNHALRLVRNAVRPSKATGLLHREYTKRGFETLLREHGFESEKTLYYNFKLIPYPLDRLLPRFTVAQSRIFEHLDKTPLKFLGTGFIVKARKL